MLALYAAQALESAQHVDLSALDIAQGDEGNDPASWWERIKGFAAKALIGFLIFVAIIFLIGFIVGFWLGKKWGKRSARKDFESSVGSLTNNE